MLRVNHRRIPKMIYVAIFLVFLLLAVQLNPPARSSVTRERAFSVEVILNKPGSSYDLTSLNDYAEKGSIKIVIEGEGNYDKDEDKEDPGSKLTYYFYRSHYHPELVVSLYEANESMYYSSGDKYEETRIEGLGMKLSIPTKEDEKEKDYETVKIKLGMQVNFTDDLIVHILKLGFKKHSFDFDKTNKSIVFMEFTRNDYDKDDNFEKDESYEKDEDYEKKDDYEKDGDYEKEAIYLSFSNDYVRKSPDSASETNETVIWVKGKNFTDDIDRDMRDILQFLSVDPTKWDNASWDDRTEKENDYNPLVELDPRNLDWSAAVEKELEWLISEYIISGLTTDDIGAILLESGGGEMVLYENGSWKSFSDTEALPTRGEGTISLSGLLDWNELPGNPPGHFDPAKPDTAYELGLIVGLIVSLIIIVLAISLYTRIRRKAILENINRRRIYERIKEKPGVHFSALLKDLGIKSGTLSHHINILEKEEFIKSRQSGMFRRFFLYGEKPLLTFGLPSIQERILKVIMDHPGISQSGISKETGSNKMKVNYHVKMMRDAELLTMEKKGRKSLCFITGAGMTFLPD